MAELSTADRLYLAVGRCLTAWNRIEEGVLYLIEYAHSDENGHSNGSVGGAYWAVVSFEARLKWCNAAMTFRTRYDGYEGLGDTWNALNNKLISKARKRAEVAHGSVVHISESAETELSTLFVPFYHRRRYEYSMQPWRVQIEKSFAQITQKLSADEINGRAASFNRASRQISDFQGALMKKDTERGFLLRAGAPLQGDQTPDTQTQSTSG